MTAKPMGPLARSEGYWGPFTGGAWRFAPGHPRLLLLVRFADEALVCSALQREKM